MKNRAGGGGQSQLLGTAKRWGWGWRWGWLTSLWSAADWQWDGEEDAFLSCPEATFSHPPPSRRCLQPKDHPDPEASKWPSWASGV